MKLSISNIAWAKEHDQRMHSFLKESNFSGLEIAPTRIFEENPYDKLNEAKQFSVDLTREFALQISSMQSICFGITDSIFGTEEERKVILDYTKKAIDFASIIHCNNLVFGCPKNRIIQENQLDIAVAFFSELGEYAQQKATILALEANPIIYGTNFINTTKQSFDFVREINCEGLKVNFDFGTFLYNQESINDIEKHLDLINHIHISEPYLEEIQPRGIHKDFSKMLIENQYDKYVSIEMKNLNAIEKVESIVKYTKELFDVA
jgi:sugar phosphate isomerase/epimerase